MERGGGGNKWGGAGSNALIYGFMLWWEPKNNKDLYISVVTKVIKTIYFILCRYASIIEMKLNIQNKPMPKLFLLWQSILNFFLVFMLLTSTHARTISTISSNLFWEYIGVELVRIGLNTLRQSHSWVLLNHQIHEKGSLPTKS